jgi:hypothetical protein
MGFKSVRVKCALLLNLVKHDIANDVLGTRMYRSRFFDLGTRWPWVVSSMPLQPFTPGGSTPGAHWKGGWVNPRVGLDDIQKLIIGASRESNHEHLSSPAVRLPLYRQRYRCLNISY